MRATASVILLIYYQCREDRPVSEQLRNERKSNPHTLFLCFWCSKNICDSPICISNVAKITQFD
jgi:hypothetical protein